MGLLTRLFDRPLTQDGFAKMLIKRLRASGETGSIEYDSEKFRLQKSTDHIFFLNNAYQQYQRWRVREFPADGILEQIDLIRST